MGKRSGVMKRFLKIALWILIPIFILLAAAWIGVTVKYWDFFSLTKTEFSVPGLLHGVVPQGFYYLEDEDVFLMSGYMTDDSASRIYVRSTSGKTHYVNLKNEDGTPYTRHCGGVCANGKFVYIAGKTGLDVFLLSDVLNGENATRQGVVETGFRVSFCDFAGGHLMAGNFYYPETYETPEEHRLVTPAGDQNYGVIAIFRESAAWEFGVDPTPIAALSIPEKVQGIAAIDKDRVILSTSYSLKSSQIFIHMLNTERPDRIQINGAPVPLYYLDSTTLQQTLTLPPMSEEMAVKDGRVYVLFESACSKYFFGNFIRGRNVYSFVP